MECRETEQRERERGTRGRGKDDSARAQEREREAELSLVELIISGKEEIAYLYIIHTNVQNLSALPHSSSPETLYSDPFPSYPSSPADLKGPRCFLDLIVLLYLRALSSLHYVDPYKYMRLLSKSWNKSTIIDTKRLYYNFHRQRASRARAFPTQREYSSFFSLPVQETIRLSLTC